MRKAKCTFRAPRESGVWSISTAIFIAALSFGSNRANAQVDPVPWPWGAICPMVAENVEGLWDVSTIGPSFKLSVKFVSQTTNGTRIFRVELFNHLERAVARGWGRAAQDGHRLTAAMYPVDANEIPPAWVTLRVANKNKKFADCLKDHIVTVLTLGFRAVDGQTTANHYELKRSDKAEQSSSYWMFNWFHWDLLQN